VGKILSSYLNRLNFGLKAPIAQMRALLTPHCFLESPATQLKLNNFRSRWRAILNIWDKLNWVAGFGLLAWAILLAVVAIMGSASAPGHSSWLSKMLVVGACAGVAGIGVYYLGRTSPDR
jgi:hypothetical protein